jgi:hypothetical protein
MEDDDLAGVELIVLAMPLEPVPGTGHLFAARGFVLRRRTSASS